MGRESLCLIVRFLFGLTESFCRHVAKTGDIKGFVVIEESGIAKGIRRIIAVTGHEAADVIRQAKNFVARIDRLDTFAGKEKERVLKELTVVRHSFFCIYPFMPG